MGGVGNQLFQFCAAINLATIHKIPLSNIKLYQGFLSSYSTRREFNIGFITNLFSGIEKNPKIPKLVFLIMKFRIAKLLDFRFGSINMISSDSHMRTACSIRNSASVFILDGYFQHPDFLFTDDFRKQIRTELLNSRQQLIEKVTNGRPSIGIHIRRGDLVGSKLYELLSFDYYLEAIKMLPIEHNILVFSDDPKESALLTSKLNSAVNIQSLNLPIEDEFCLFMSCNHHVIANSTFSWWGSYLGYKPLSRVISPNKWYTNNLQNQENPLQLSYFEVVDN